MKTSRIARETAKVVKSISHADYAPRRHTRSFEASIQAFNASDLPLQEKADIGVKQLDSSDNGSSLSSITSPELFDIEDTPLKISPSRKRKRGLETPSTTVRSSSTVITARSSPRKPDLKTEDDGITRNKKGRRQPARIRANEAGEVEIHPPGNWEEIYDAVREMRKLHLAPVDTMGCETLAEEHLTPRDKRFQTLIALMLSSQTKDTTNAIAMRKLQTELPAPGLTLENILAVDPVKLNELIYVVGFHNNKTRYIKASALILRDQYAGDIPDTIDGLMSLPGVGPKMAYLCLSAAWDKTEGIGVDVHVHRITNLWGWHKTKGPEETRITLQNWLPRKRWHEINHLLVGFGQTICLPVGRKCGNCTLSVKGLCPSAVVERKIKSVKRVKREEVGGERKGKVVEVAVKAEEEITAEGVKSEVLKEETIIKEEGTGDDVQS